jgi:4-hydroxy-2-oxoheptanedioate aldolase
MTTNRLRQLVRERPAIGAWCILPSPIVAELMASAGFDFLIFDCQHGSITDSDVHPMLQAVARMPVTPVVRVVGNDPQVIGRALDAGAEGVIVPMVNSAEDARRAAAACRYHPEGTRSWARTRADLFLGSDPAVVNREVLCLVMIETEEAVANAAAIAATPGVDGIFVGPADLGLTLGVSPGAAADNAPLAAALADVVVACHDAGRIPGIAGGTAYIEQGFRIVTTTSDIGLIRGAAAHAPVVQ